MKTLFIIISIFISILAKSQTGIITQTISVKGNCDDCKERIENAADIKGVKTSHWNKQDKTLTVTFNSAKVNIEQIEKAIAKAGHQTTSQKADSAGYKALPSCCKYESTDCKKK